MYNHMVTYLTPNEAVRVGLRAPVRSLTLDETDSAFFYLRHTSSLTVHNRRVRAFAFSHLLPLLISSSVHQTRVSVPPDLLTRLSY